MKTWLPFLIAPMLGLLLGVVRTCAAPTSEATITSDEMEMRESGEKTFFRRHVVLKDDPYALLADEMMQIKATGNVSAQGHLEGTWRSDKGEKVKAYGDEGLYTPTPPKTELWGKRPRLIRWETERDTAPVQVTADRFIADHQTHEFFASGDVEIIQKPKAQTRSDRARYDQKVQTIYLYGPARVFVHVADAQWTGDFTAERGWLTLDPKTAHLAGRVQGHISPSQAL